MSVRKLKHPARKQARWSGEITRHSNALDLEENVFTQRSPRRIAASLKRSADASRRRKGTAFQSAMSMLNFYINRAGSRLSEERKNVLDRAKQELRRAFGRTQPKPRATAGATRAHA